jgi:hypothetical protein
LIALILKKQIAIALSQGNHLPRGQGRIKVVTLFRRDIELKTLSFELNSTIIIFYASEYLGRIGEAIFGVTPVEIGLIRVIYQLLHFEYGFLAHFHATQ